MGLKMVAPVKLVYGHRRALQMQHAEQSAIGLDHPRTVVLAHGQGEWNAIAGGPVERAEKGIEQRIAVFQNDGVHTLLQAAGTRTRIVKIHDATDRQAAADHAVLQALACAGG